MGYLIKLQCNDTIVDRQLRTIEPINLKWYYKLQINNAPSTESHL